MRQVRYPSESFSRAVEELTANNEEFSIIIDENYKYRKVIMEKLAVLLSDWKEPNGWLKSVFRTFRIRDFYLAISTAVANERYKIGYESRGDLLISFEPIETQKSSSCAELTKK